MCWKVNTFKCNSVISVVSQNLSHSLGYTILLVLDSNETHLYFHGSEDGWARFQDPHYHTGGEAQEAFDSDRFLLRDGAASIHMRFASPDEALFRKIFHHTYVCACDIKISQQNHRFGVVPFRRRKWTLIGLCTKNKSSSLNKLVWGCELFHFVWDASSQLESSISSRFWGVTCSKISEQMWELSF